MLAKRFLDAFGLNPIADRRRCSVGVDITSRLLGNAGIVNGIQHHATCAVAILGRRCNVVRVPAHTISGQLSEDRRPAAHGAVQTLQNQNAGIPHPPQSCPGRRPRGGKRARVHHSGSREPSWTRTRRCRCRRRRPHVRRCQGLWKDPKLEARTLKPAMAKKMNRPIFLRSFLST